MTRGPSDALQRVGSYNWPRPPATTSLRQRFRQLRNKVGLAKPDPAKKAPERLETLSKTLLPDSIWAALQARYHALLDNQLLHAADLPHRVNALVTLPSLPEGFVEEWATKRGLSISQRGALPAATKTGTKEVNLVALAPMAHRTLSARAATRRQLDALAEASLQSDKGQSEKGSVLLFGSSWAWTYLARTSSLQAVVADPFCFPAYDGTALAALIKDHLGPLQLKSVESGKDILKCDDEGRPKDSYLATLAAMSSGCPWAALQMLEDAATQQKDPESDTSGEDNPTDIRWICDPTPPTLPDHLGRAGHFLLHALLVQGPLSAEDLGQSVPLPLPTGLSAALVRAGLVEVHQGKLQLVTRSYPHIRQLLTEAGFPADQI